MSAENKTRFEVQRILRNSLMEGLRYASLDPGAYDVMESNQRPLTAAKDAVLFKMLDSARAGWQATKFRTERDSQGSVTGYYRDDCFIDEQTWMVVVLTRRPSTDSGGGRITADTRLAEDVAQCLIAWFNGPGCMAIRKDGVSVLYVKQKPVEVYKDSSSLYEKSASFRLKMLVPKRISHGVEAARIEYGGECPI